MKKFNESKFTNYLSSLIDDFNNPSTEYDKGAFETLKRIINEFEADHYDQDQGIIMSKITDIWKEKYGISNFEKTINITSKDNIYKIFKKTAKFIYKNGMANGDFDEKTELEAIQHLKDNFFDQKDATITQIDKSKLTDVEKKNLKAAYKFDDTTFGKCHFYQMDYRNGYHADQSKLLIVDPSNTTSIKDKVNLRWRYY